MWRKDLTWTIRGKVQKPLALQSKDLVGTIEFDWHPIGSIPWFGFQP